MPRIKSDDPDHLRTVKTSIVVTPAIKRNMDKIATMQQKTLNSLIVETLENYIKKHHEEIKKYDATFEKD